MGGQSENIHRPRPGPEPAEAEANRFGGNRLGAPGGLEGLEPVCQMGRKRRGVCAARAVRRAIRISRAGNLHQLAAVEEDVHRLLAVSAGDDHARWAKGVHRSSQVADRSIACHGAEDSRLGHSPYDGNVPAASGAHTIKIRRRGYAVQRFDIDLTADVDRKVTLLPSASS